MRLAVAGPRDGMTRREREQLTRTALLGVTLTAAVVAADRVGLLVPLENGLYDRRTRLCQFFLPPVTDRLVHLDIDDASLDAVGRWPWPRSELAAIVEEVRLAGAATIAFDVVFAEPQPVELVEPQAGRYERIDHDTELAEVIARHGRVVVPIVFSAGGQRSAEYRELVRLLARDPELEPAEAVGRLREAGSDIDGRADEDRDRFVLARAEAMYERIDAALEAGEAITREELRAKLLPRTTAWGITDSALTRLLDKQYLAVQAERAVRRLAVPGPGRHGVAPAATEGLPPISQLSRAAAGTGSVYYAPDRDGVVRSLDLLVEYRGRLYPQLGLAAACAHLGVDLSRVRVEAGSVVLPASPVAGRDIRLPIHRRPASRYAPASEVVFDLPWFGRVNEWETMYDPAHRSPARHVPLTMAWQAVETRRSLAANNTHADDAIRFLYANCDPAKLEAYEGDRPALDDPVARLPVIESLLNDPFVRAAAEDYAQQKRDGQELDGQGKGFLEAYRALEVLLEQNRRLGEQLQQQRSALRAAMDGRAAIVGWTATAAAADFVPTSLHTKCPGVVVHGVVFNAILTGELWRRAPQWAGPVLTAALGLAATGLRCWFNVAAATAACFSLLIAYLLVNGLAAFDYGNLILPLASPAVVVPLVWGVCTVQRVLAERAERARITRRFQSYVDPALVNYVIEHPENTRFDGQVREITVVFTDLSGFTTFTEKLQERAVPLLNEYMEAMVPIIRRHRGYVNKFLGDGIMCFYGAPWPNELHARDAILTALTMQEEMDLFNASLAARALPQLKMRIGISAGPMVVGDAGPASASDYTVLGDAVNLGARLESANKYTGTWVLCNQRAAELAWDHFLFRPIARLHVVGKSEGVMTYEPLGLKSEATDEQRRLVERTAEVVDAFVAADFRRCLRCLESMEQEFGESQLTRLYRQRASEHAQRPPGSDFAGQIVLESK